MLLHCLVRLFQTLEQGGEEDLSLPRRPFRRRVDGQGR